MAKEDLMGSYAPYHDERCVDNPYGLNDSSEQLIHLPSLAVSLTFSAVIYWNISPKEIISSLSQWKYLLIDDWQDL